MNRLKIKRWLSLLSFTLGILLFQGCEPSFEDPNSKAFFGFIESEQIVEVDVDTKSFRIIGEWTQGRMFDNLPRFPYVYLDTINTTALPGVHFINHIDPEVRTIGEFAPTDYDNLYYREVKLIPKNITSEIIIHYYTNVNINISNLIIRHKVILKQKEQNK